MTAERVPFDETFLARSAEWLRDPEIARLSRAPAIEPEAQRRWWEGLPERTDYAVWGISYDGVPVGAMGIKAIGVNDGAEYFMYIGDVTYWGRGISRWAFDEIVEEVRSRGLRYLYGVTGKDNPRSMAVNLRNGFRIVEERADDYLLAYDLEGGRTSE